MATQFRIAPTGKDRKMHAKITQKPVNGVFEIACGYRNCARPAEQLVHNVGPRCKDHRLPPKRLWKVNRNRLEAFLAGEREIANGA